MKMKKMVFAVFAIWSVGTSAAFAQPMPIPGYSAPALTFRPPVSGFLTDEFDGAALSNLWVGAVSEEQARRGGSIVVRGGRCTMTSELTPAGVPGGPVGLISAVPAFAQQSFSLSSRMQVGSRQGEYGIFFGLSDLQRPGEPAARFMGVTLYHAQHATPGGQPLVDEFVLVADGTFGPPGGAVVVPWPGLFAALTTPFTVNLDYDTATGALSVAIPEIGFSHTLTASWDGPRTVGLLAGGGGGPAGPTFDSQVVVTAEWLRSTLGYTLPAAYLASLAPFQLDGIRYDGAALFGRPGEIFLDPAVAPQPSVILGDGAPVPADGATSYALALITVSDGGAAPLTVITTLDRTQLEAIPGATVNAHIPGFFVAQGWGADYRVDWGPIGWGILAEFATIITPDLGLAQSLFRKLEGIRAAYDTGAWRQCLQRIDALRREVIAQRGKKIGVAVADEILGLLAALERVVASSP